MAGQPDLGTDRAVGGVGLQVVEVRGDPHLPCREVGLEGLQLLERGNALTRRTGESVSARLEHVFYLMRWVDPCPGSERICGQTDAPSRRARSSSAVVAPAVLPTGPGPDAILQPQPADSATTTTSSSAGSGGTTSSQPSVPSATPGASRSLTAASDALAGWRSRSRTPPPRPPAGFRSPASPRRSATCHGNEAAGPLSSLQPDHRPSRTARIAAEACVFERTLRGRACVFERTLRGRSVRLRAQRYGSCRRRQTMALFGDSPVGGGSVRMTLKPSRS